MAEISESKKQIDTWLEGIFGKNGAPDYEINEQTISYLNKILTLCTKNDMDIRLVIDDLHQKQAEYDAEAKRLATILEGVGLNPSCLSHEGTSHLTALVKMAEILDLRNASDSNYYLAIQALDDEVDQVNENVLKETKKLQKLTEITSKTESKLQAIEKMIQLTKKKIADELKLAQIKKKDTIFYQKKAKSYDKDISKLQARLSMFDPAITHESQVKKQEALTKLKAELEPLKSELQSYLDLPPNLSETKILVEKKRREMKDLETMLAQKIDMSFM